jgi:hypothetical protein
MKRPVGVTPTAFRSSSVRSVRTPSLGIVVLDPQRASFTLDPHIPFEAESQFEDGKEDGKEDCILQVEGVLNHGLSIETRMSSEKVFSICEVGYICLCLCVYVNMYMYIFIYIYILCIYICI